MILQTDMSRHFEILGKFRMRANTLKDFNEGNIEDRIAILCMALKCADLGHSTKIFELHERWTRMVSEEFFIQGDLEKTNNMPVSMYCDRETTDLAKSQAGFLKNVCLPLFEVFIRFLRSEKAERDCLQQLEKNLSAWEELSKTKASSVIKICFEK